MKILKEFGLQVERLLLCEGPCNLIKVQKVTRRRPEQELAGGQHIRNRVAME